MHRLALVLVVVACSKADSPKQDPGVTPATPEIKVELAGVTLAEDCGEGTPTKATPPPIQTAAAGSGMMTPDQKRAAESVAAGAAMADCAGPDCGGLPSPPCEQTSMQLSVKVPTGATPTKIRIKQVELLDDTGKPLATLAARAPSRWDGNAYVAWDESVAGSLSASYKLAAPDWNKLTNGRWNAPSKRFSLRVTVTISDKDRTIEKQSIVPTMPEPHVVT